MIRNKENCTQCKNKCLKLKTTTMIKKSRKSGVYCGGYAETYTKNNE